MGALAHQSIAYRRRWRPWPVRFLKRLASLFVASLTLTSHGTSASEVFPDIVDRVRPAIVAVGAAYPRRQPIGDRAPYRIRGTGFAVLDGLHIVTNDHVLPDKLDTDRRETIAVFVGRGREAQVRPARLLSRDEDHDLALLQIDGEPLATLPLADDKAVREGEAIAITGFPIGAVLGFFPATHRGFVAALTPMARAADRGRQLSAVQRARLRDPFDVYQLDIVAYPGNSGSPVYRVADGALIGVVNSVFVKESRESALTSPSGITYAIPLRHVQALLTQAAGAEAGS